MENVCSELSGWYLAAGVAVLFLGGAVAAAVGVLIGGPGEHSVTRRRIDGVEGDLAVVSERLTREQKQRAGLQGGRPPKGRTDAELAAEASQYLGPATGAPAPSQRRPSVVNFRRS